MKIFFVFMMVLGTCLLVSYDSAQALRLTLKRVIFEESKRTEVLTIINNTDQPETYRLGWRNYQMTETQSLVAIPDDSPLPPEIKPVSDMVVFSPRRILIAPQSSQQVRMMLRVPANLPDGEYRSHFWIRPEAPAEDILSAMEGKKMENNTGSVSMTMLAGVTMPVIVRKGALEVTAGIENFVAASVDRSVDISLTLTREGERSVYGDLEFVCNPDSADRYVLTVSRGIAIYPEVNKRTLSLDYDIPLDMPACRDLLLMYIETEGFEGQRTVVMAEARATVK